MINYFSKHCPVLNGVGSKFTFKLPGCHSEFLTGDSINMIPRSHSQIGTTFMPDFNHDPSSKYRDYQTIPVGRQRQTN
jgi:hypothetical protein